MSRTILLFFAIAVMSGLTARAQDEQSKKLIEALERIDKLNEIISKLKDEKQSLKDENAKQAETIAKLESQIEVSLDKVADERKKSKKEEKEIKDAIPKGSVWKGKYYTEHLGKSATQSAKFEVTERDVEAKTVTFLQTIENGAIWEFHCKLIGDKKMQIEDVRRIRAAKGLENDPNRPPVGGVRGGGNIAAKKLILNFVWSEADNGPLSGKFDLSPSE